MRDPQAGPDPVGATAGLEPEDRVVDVAAREGTGAGSGPGTALAVRVHRPSGQTAHAAGPSTGQTSPGSAVLVHGLASNARMWDACAAALASAGTTSVAVDLRGHGRSGGEGPFTTAVAAADVLAVTTALLDDGTLRAPVVLAGQSWGGNVALTAAADQDRPWSGPFDALALVDGGWLRFDHDQPFEQLWHRLAPPTWQGATWQSVTERLDAVLGAWGPHALPAVLANLTTDASGAVRNRLPLPAHEQVLRSMYDGDPRELYPAVHLPVLLAPAGDGPAAGLVHEAMAGLPDARLRRYADAHHDLHLQHPGRLAADLLELLRDAGSRTTPSPTDVESR